MSEEDYAIRPARGAADAVSQYELWLRATADLPRAWRSSLRNVEHQLENAERYPGCRLYAERPDGTLRGYIGTHPPFEWVGTQHGPPTESLGWAIPFGLPWTDPRDDGLAAALYDAMIRTAPEVYAEFQRDIYIQRFRESWAAPLAFLEQRGWRLLERIPLIGREVVGLGANSAASRALSLVTRDDLALVGDLCGLDDTAVDKLTTEDLQQRYDAGWIVSDTFWRLGERGAFAIEQRGRWAAVTLLFARPEAWDETLHAASGRAAELGAAEIYFTVEAYETRLRAALEKRGFGEVDAGVYYVREAD